LYVVIFSLMEKNHVHPGKVSIVSQDITEIPTDLRKKYGEVKELAITFCRLTHVSNLDDFSTTLVSLVLDNNEIGSDMNVFPALPHLETLWVNNNNIQYLDRFLSSIQGKVPSLKYLSMLKNPCCPNYFVGKGTVDYKKYRAQVVKEIPTLKFLDSSPITQEELGDADNLKKDVRRPDPSQYQKQSEGFPVPEDKALPKDDSEAVEKASFGRTKYVYYGRQSEGNRFIIDKNLWTCIFVLFRGASHWVYLVYCQIQKIK